MKLLFIPFFILLYFSSIAQTGKRKSTVRKSVVFPTQFIGEWKGTMYWYPNNNKPSISVQVALTIQPIKDSTDQFTWLIEYGDNKKDIRSYTLKKIDTLKNHWVIDENNGILLDSYWLGNRFSGVFSINNQVILDSYWIENNELHFEFFSYLNQPLTTTSATAETKENEKDVTPVVSYKMSSYQKAVLTKKVNKPK